MVDSGSNGRPVRLPRGSVVGSARHESASARLHRDGFQLYCASKGASSPEAEGWI